MATTARRRPTAPRRARPSPRRAASPRTRPRPGAGGDDDRRRQGRQAGRRRRRDLGRRGRRRSASGSGPPSPTRSTSTATTSRRRSRPAARRRFDFPADIEGLFEVELARRRRTDRRAAGQPVERGAIAMNPLQVLPFAHALVAREDLPIPAWLFAWGASIVLIVSFFALSAAWREPRFEDERWRPLSAGRLAGPARPARAGPLRRGRRLPARRRRLRGPGGHRSAGSQLRRHLRLRHLLAGLPRAQRRPRQRLQAVQPVAGGRPRGRRRLRGDRRPALRPPPATRRASAAGRRPLGLVAFVWLEVVYGVSGGVAVGVSPHAIGGRRPRLQRLHAGDDGRLRGRGVVREGRGLLGLLRDVLPARRPRGQRRAARPAAAVLGGDALGDGARLARAS